MRLEYRRFNYCATSRVGRTSHFSLLRDSPFLIAPKARRVAKSDAVPNCPLAPRESQIEAAVGYSDILWALS